MFFQKSIGKFLFSAALVLVGLQVNAAPGKTGSKTGGSRSASESVSPEMQATKHVRGTVLDETGQGVPGASIVVKGETRGVMADENGHFEIDVKSSDVLVVYYLGYEEQSVPVGNQTELVIKLVPTANALEEVTVVAYGAQRKASVIGSIATVSTDALATGVRGNLSTGLAGQLAGIVSVQTTGEPGSSANFWIRGINTFGANSTPLVIVDGVERSMDLVDVDDIASFSILKDATATAVYGVRGANGIIIITTKRGAESKPKVQIKYEHGITQPVRLPEVCNTSDWIDYYNELYVDQGMDAPISDYKREMHLSNADPDMYPNVNWVHTIFKPLAQTDKANVSVTGGNKNIRYYVGGSYYFEGGIFNADNDRYDAQLNYNKFSFRSNVDINITKSTILGLSLATAYTMKNAANTDRNDLYAYTLYATPIGYPVRFQDGTLSGVQNASSPYNLLNHTGYRRFNEIVAQSLLSLTQDFSDIITEGLTANVKFSWDATNNVTLSRTINPTTYRLDGRDPETGENIYVNNNEGTNYMSLGRSNGSSTTINMEAAINYERQFAHAHRVGAMFLFSMRNYTNNVPGSYVYAFPYKNMGLAGRTTYSFKDRYFAEFNFGYNGSENFAPGHRFGFFPSYAVGYLISNEPFWDGIKNTVNNLKFKASYGKIGNDQIGGNRRFAYNTTLNTGAGGFYFGSGNRGYQYGLSTGDVGNYNVTWEEATKFNAGFELGLFNDFELQFDYFSDLRDGIFIMRQSTPTVVGLNVQQYVNIGKMKNAGFDMSANYNHTFANGFNLSARGNYTFNRNKILYNDQPDQIFKYQNTVGFAHNQQRGLIAEGLFKNQDDIDNWPTQAFGSVRPGDIKYRDINGDGVVDDYDRVAIGYTTVPEINYGFGVSVGYKGWDASVFFSGVAHYTRFISGNLVWGAASNIDYYGNILADVAEKRWTLSNQNPNAEYPRLTLNKNENNQRNSTYWQRDMSFMRLKNAEIGYTLPKNLTKKAGISTLRLYLQGVNLLTFSKFKLWDPELASNYGNGYPTMRTVCLGANINF